MSESMGQNKAPFKLTELSLILNDEQAHWASDWPMKGVVTDSRQVQNGNIFVAIKGENFDGHSFLPAIARISKVFAVVSEPESVQGITELPSAIVPDTVEALGKLARYHRARFSIPLVAVTGSYGKTSTRALIHAALSQKFNTLTSQGNFNNEIGLPMTLLQLDGHEAAVVEMGMRGRGQIEYLAKIAVPTVGVITNVGPQHIELLGSVEEIAAAKAELLENLPESGLAVLPADSTFLDFLKSKAHCRIVTFGTSQSADYRVTNIQTGAEGNISAEINGHKVNIPLPGAHNAINAAAAFAVAVELGVTPEAAIKGLEAAQLPGARMRVLKLDNGLTVIDDCYNAGPDSMRAALQTLLDFPGSGRRIAILGSMKELGAHSEAEHRRIGAFVGQFAEVLVGVGGDTRPLLNTAIASAKEIENEMSASYCSDAAEAAGRVGEWLQSGDVVLVKGSRSIGLEVVVEAVKGL